MRSPLPRGMHCIPAGMLVPLCDSCSSCSEPQGEWSWGERNCRVDRIPFSTPLSFPTRSVILGITVLFRLACTGRPLESGRWITGLGYNVSRSISLSVPKLVVPQRLTQKYSAFLTKAAIEGQANFPPLSNYRRPKRKRQVMLQVTDGLKEGVHAS